MADCLVYSKNGPVLGNRDRKGLKSDTTPVLTEFTFTTIHLLGTSQVFRELHWILVATLVRS